jgi:hypothetical protein
VLDAAQALGHVPLAGCAEADILVAGAHKWLGAYHPLGIAFLGRRATAPLISAGCQKMIDLRQLDDPLLSFLTEMKRGSLDGHGETVNLSPLFSCQGALAGEPCASGVSKRLRVQLANAQRLGEVVARSGWVLHSPAAALCSGIVLLESTSPQVQAMPAASLRSAFHACGVTLSAYDKGLIRISTPRIPWRPQQLALLRSALRDIATCPTRQTAAWE